MQSQNIRDVMLSFETERNNGRDIVNKVADCKDQDEFKTVGDIEVNSVINAMELTDCCQEESINDRGARKQRDHKRSFQNLFLLLTERNAERYRGSSRSKEASHQLVKKHKRSQGTARSVPSILRISYTRLPDFLPPQVTGFTNFRQRGGNNWYDRDSPLQPPQISCHVSPKGKAHPICCGPSEVRPIFDIKIEKLEQQIVKYCFEIRDINILLGQCCRAKDALLRQKLILHNILLKLAEKTKHLETKLYNIQMIICCPRMPVMYFSEINCREEIEAIRNLEDKLETICNAVKHKTSLLEIGKKSCDIIRKDLKDWDVDMSAMHDIEMKLKRKLDQMRSAACIKKSSHADRKSISAKASRYSRDELELAPRQSSRSARAGQRQKIQ